MPTLLDRLRGRAPKPRPFDVLGSSGAVVVGGYLELNERQPELRGTDRYRTFSDLLANVSIVAAGVRFFLNLLSKSNWKVEPPDEAAREHAEIFESMLYDMATPWSRVVRRAGMYRMHGFSIQEWTAKRRTDGWIGFLDVAPRPQVTIERWEVDEAGDVLGCWQRIPQTQRDVFLPRPKLVYGVDDSLSDTPEGLGLFRHLAEPAKRLRKFQLLEAYGFEADLAGIPVVRAPLEQLNRAVTTGQMQAAERDAFLRPLRAFLEKHVKNPALSFLLDSTPYRAQDEARTPSSVKQWDVELLQSNAAQSSVAVAAAIERVNREMARVLGVEGLLLGTDARGSNALSRDKSQSFGLIVDSTLSELGLVFEHDLVGPCWALNGWPDETKPTLKADATQFRDIEALAKVLSDLASAGAPLDPDDPVIGEFRDLMGLSRPLEVSERDEDAAIGGRPGEDDDEPLPEDDGAEDGDESGGGEG